MILRNGSVLRVEGLPDGSITFGSLTLEPGAPTGVDGGAAAFGDVPPPADYCSLLDGPWTTTGALNLTVDTHQVVYFADGTSIESYRWCQCSHQSRWSFDQGTLIKKPDAHSCRGFGTLATLDPIGVTLAPGASYSTSVVIVPTVSGTFDLMVTPLYRDVNQDYGAYKSYYDFTVLPGGG